MEYTYNNEIVSPIKIFLSDTKIKITNPGGYIYDGTFRTPVEKLIRNPLIKQMNAIILGRDELTNGMNRILNLLKISGYTEPIIESNNNTFSITMTNESIIHIYNGLNIDEVCEYCKTPNLLTSLWANLMNPLKINILMLKDLLNEKNTLSSSSIEVLDKVFTKYSPKDSWSLSILTHGEISWKNSRIGIPEGENGDNAMKLSDIKLDAERIKQRRIMRKQLDLA